MGDELSGVTVIFSILIMFKSSHNNKRIMKKKHNKNTREKQKDRKQTTVTVETNSAVLRKQGHMERLGLVAAFGTRSRLQTNPERPQLIIYSLGAAFPRVKEMAWWVKHLLYSLKTQVQGPEPLE